MFVVWYFVVLVFLHQAGYNTASVRWPEGTYGLLKPKTGCPEEWTEKQWEQNCFINQDTANNKPNEKSKVLHIDGNFHASSVKRYFCIKTTQSGSTWPKGQYCIYSKYQLYSKSQPMDRGSILMFNEWHHNQDISKSCKNYFVFKTYTYMYTYITLQFSCETSGNKKIPISLPITKPFYLLPYGSRDCQQVQWMVATFEWIKYQTLNNKNYHNEYGTVPYYKVGDRNHKGITMFYCYYKGCNNTFTDKRGVFQSPGFPGKYPDRQLCSWRITVPDNHTIHVHFTNFSLYEYDKDCLQLYENNSGILEPKQAFFGHQRPFTITATSNLMFVFRSDEENNSTGFRAEYKIFKPAETTTTTTPKPSTTTTPPTTTQPTTKPPTTKQQTTTLPTTTRRITTEPTTTFPPTTLNINSTTNETIQCHQNQETKNKSYNKLSIYPMKKTCFCEENWKVAIMVLPMAVFILIVLVIIDIFCRCRSKKALTIGASAASAGDGMAVNPTYERGNIILDQTRDITSDTSTLNSVNDPPQSRDEPPDYEDVDYTQLNDIPPPRRSSKRQECHALEPIGTDTSSVFYHVLEPPKTESGGSQYHAAEPVGNGALEVFYHTLEPTTDFTRPSYQNLSEVNHYTLNPAYESPQNSAC